MPGITVIPWDSISIYDSGKRLTILVFPSNGPIQLQSKRLHRIE